MNIFEDFANIYGFGDGTGYTCKQNNTHYNYAYWNKMYNEPTFEEFDKTIEEWKILRSQHPRVFYFLTDKVLEYFERTGWCLGEWCGELCYVKPRKPIPVENLLFDKVG